jgi:hypothetical protein
VSGDEYYFVYFSFYNFLVDKKIKFKVLTCSFEIAYYFENPSGNPFKDPKAAISTLKILTGSRL